MSPQNDPSLNRLYKQFIVDGFISIKQELYDISEAAGKVIGESQVFDLATDFYKYMLQTLILDA